LIKPADGIRVSTNDVSPLFSLAAMDPEYSVEQSGERPLAEFAHLLRRLAQLTWGQIQSRNRRQLGHEQIPRDQLKPSVVGQVPEDRVPLVFRAGSHVRVIGYRDGAVLHVVAVDHDLSTYGH
jgi:hypothetical protein